MFRQFCDRCHADVTDKLSGHVNGVEHADNERGDGVVTHQADLCVSCYRDFVKLLGATTVGKLRVDARGRLAKRRAS